ncbi:MAG: hypothetical protein ABJJ37_27105 [Roseibium sp.]
MVAHIEANFDAFLKGVTDVEKRQIPFAIALTLNATIEDVETNTVKSLLRRLDRPTPFTLRGLAKRKATKRNMVATLFFKDLQADYLEKQETGGERRPKGRAITIPVGQRLNKYGNMPKGAIKRLLARPDVFSGRVNGVGGIWQRPKGRRKALKLLVAFKQKATYRPRLRFQSSALKTTKARIGLNWRRSFSHALKTTNR